MDLADGFGGNRTSERGEGGGEARTEEASREHSVQVLGLWAMMISSRIVAGEDQRLGQSTWAASVRNIWDDSGDAGAVDLRVMSCEVGRRDKAALGPLWSLKTDQDILRHVETCTLRPSWTLDASSLVGRWWLGGSSSSMPRRLVPFLRYLHRTAFGSPPRAIVQHNIVDGGSMALRMVSFSSDSFAVTMTATKGVRQHTHTSAISRALLTIWIVDT